MELQSAAWRVFRSWLVHWLTSVALTLLVFFLLYPFPNSALYRFLDHLGGDAVVRAYGGEPEPAARVVVVDIGPEPTVDMLTDSLNKIAGTDALSVGVDFQIKELQPRPDGAADKRITNLRGALAALRMRIAMPIISDEIAGAINGLRIREASVELVLDDDGVVRTTQERSCTSDYGGHVTLPTLAAAVSGIGLPYEFSKGTGCEKSEDARPILFAPVQTPYTSSKDRTGIYIMSKEMLAEHATLLNGAYVIVGDASPASTSDHFMTPVGLQPGAIIHAEAVWTFAVQGKSTTTIPRDLLLVALELLVGITSGAYFAALLVIREACEPAAPPRGHARQGGRARDKHEIDSPLAAFVRLIWGLGGIALMALALIIIGAFWTWLATSLLRSGVVIGAAAAVFGAMLETLLHTGEDVVGPLHWTMACAVKRILVSLAIVLICAAPLAARAEECTYYITSGPNDKVESEPPHAHPEGEPRWRPWERVHVKANTSIRVRPAEGSPDEYTDFPAHQVDISVVLPPCPRKGGSWASWFNFWAAWPPRETKTASGATVLYKGVDDGEQAAQHGPLRELAGLGPASGVVAGTEGLALAWAGGSPPFSVTFEDAGDGSLLGRAHTERRYLWLPGWQPPASPFVVTIQDSLGAVLRHRLRLLPPASVAGGGVAEAIQLYETAPEYRMEALRRLAARSEAGDDLAERAVELIRVAGGAQ